MPQATNGSITLEYDVFGADDDPTILLVMGLGAQMIAWRPEFVELLVAGGYRVIRFDNRDAGLSTHSEGRPPKPSKLLKMIAARRLPIRGPKARYTLTHMASDAIAVLDEVGVSKAHFVGVSMGGMISQMAAIKHPDRVASLTSIMSTTGRPTVGYASPRLIRQLLSPAPERPEDALEWGVERYGNIAGPLYDPAAMRDFLRTANKRAYHPEGLGFQLQAILATGDRTDRLRTLDLPTLVIHGREDRLVHPTGGRATAKAIRGAELVMVHQMGHDLPTPLWPELTDSILGFLQRVDTASAPV